MQVARELVCDRGRREVQVSGACLCRSTSVDLLVTGPCGAPIRVGIDTSLVLLMSELPPAALLVGRRGLKSDR
jgi:hypothetical protein